MVADEEQVAVRASLDLGLVVSCRVSWMRRAGAGQGQRRRGEAREIEEARSKHARLILGNPSQAWPEHHEH